MLNGLSNERGSNGGLLGRVGFDHVSGVLNILDLDVADGALAHTRLPFVFEALLNVLLLIQASLLGGQPVEHAAKLLPLLLFDALELTLHERQLASHGRRVLDLEYLSQQLLGLLELVAQGQHLGESILSFRVGGFMLENLQLHWSNPMPLMR